MQKSCFLCFEWWKWNFATFGPSCKHIFGQSLDISVGARKFLGVRRIVARSPPNLPKVLCDFANKFSPIKNPFWVWPRKKDSCVFLHTLGTIFWSQTTLGDSFARISINQNIWVALWPPAPPSPTPLPVENPLLALVWKNPSGAHAYGYMIIYRNAEGMHGQRKFGNPWIERSNLLLQSETVSKVAKKFKIRFSNPLQFRLSKNSRVQIQFKSNKTLGCGRIPIQIHVHQIFRNDHRTQVPEFAF